MSTVTRRTVLTAIVVLTCLVPLRAEDAKKPAGLLDTIVSDAPGNASRSAPAIPARIASSPRLVQQHVGAPAMTICGIVAVCLMTDDFSAIGVGTKAAPVRGERAR